MKINDKIISSLDSLRANFDFIEIWNKREVAIRDLSPLYIYYPDDIAVYYEVFANPGNVINDNGKLIFHTESEDVELSLDIDNKLLSKFSFTERVQILALHAIANVQISETVKDVLIDVVSIDDDKITLKNGSSINYGKKKNGEKTLTHKSIVVSATSKKNSKVGNITLAPGQMTFGVFSGKELIDVVPPCDENHTYRLEYEMCDDTVTLNVTDIATCNIVAKYKNAHYYALIGEKDFVVIDGLLVSCFANEDLNNRLRDNVIKSKIPEMLKVDSNAIHVIYRDKSEKIINIM